MTSGEEQQIDKPVPVAAFWRRLLATAYDLLLVTLTLLTLLLGRISLSFWRFSEPITDPDPSLVYTQWKSDFTQFLGTSGILLCLYFVFVEMMTRKGTLGKFLLGISIVSHDGSPAERKQLFLRQLGKFILGPLTLGLSWMAALLSPSRQTWHDRLAKTLVIRDKDLRSTQ